MKQDISNFDSDPFPCDTALFTAKYGPNSAKSNRIFPRKGRGERALILTYLDSLMVGVFRRYNLFFSISSRGNEVQSWTKSAVLFGQSFFHKNSDPSKKILNNVFVCQSITPGENCRKLDHIWGSKCPKTSQKEHFMGAESVRKTLKFFDLTTKNSILMKLITIMYPRKTVNQNLLEPKIQFIGLIFQEYLDYIKNCHVCNALPCFASLVIFLDKLHHNWGSIL